MQHCEIAPLAGQLLQGQCSKGDRMLIGLNEMVPHVTQSPLNGGHAVIAAALPN
jgi:hypothetical protein